MSAVQPRTVVAVIFWALLVVLVLVDWVRGASLHNRFDEPLPWALGSGSSPAGKGAHCTVAPPRK